MMQRNSKGEVHIGDAHGKIAMWMDEAGAVEVAAALHKAWGFTDTAITELEQAILVAYPEEKTHG